MGPHKILSKSFNIIKFSRGLPTPYKGDLATLFIDQETIVVSYDNMNDWIKIQLKKLSNNRSYSGIGKSNKGKIIALSIHESGLIFDYAIFFKKKSDYNNFVKIMNKYKKIPNLTGDFLDRLARRSQT